MGFFIDCSLYYVMNVLLPFSLIQAQLGSISVQDFGLIQDTAKIFRNGMRISKCMFSKSWLTNQQSAVWLFFSSALGLSELLSQRSKMCFSAVLNSLILAKCFRSKLWENSHFVSKQLEKIGGYIAVFVIPCYSNVMFKWWGFKTQCVSGQTLSSAMVNAGLTTFNKIEQINPRELELVSLWNIGNSNTLSYDLWLCLMTIHPMSIHFKPPCNN